MRKGNAEKQNTAHPMQDRIAVQTRIHMLILNFESTAH